MTKYTYDGTTIEASSSKELVRKMHESSEAPARTDKDWMAQVSHRIEVQFGKPLDLTSVDAFVEGLQAIGVLKIIE